MMRVLISADMEGIGGVVSSNGRPEHVGEFTLPSGKIVYIGTGYFERYDGQLFEWNGVVPDVLIPQTGTDTDQGADKQLEFAMEWILTHKNN